MDSLLMVAQLLALISVTALCVYLIMLAVRARDFLASLEKDMKEMTSRAVPVLDHLEVVTSRLKSIAENVDDQVSAVRESIVSVKAIADNIVDLERKVQERVEGPILDAVGYIAAVVKGIRTFAQRVRS